MKDYGDKRWGKDMKRKKPEEPRPSITRMTWALVYGVAVHIFGIQADYSKLRE